MDENDLADILQAPNKFQVPHETEGKQDCFFEEAENNYDEGLFKELDEDHEPEDEEEISLESYDKDCEEEYNQVKRQSKRVRVPPQRWKILQVRA